MLTKTEKSFGEQLVDLYPRLLGCARASRRKAGLELSMADAQDMAQQTVVKCLEKEHMFETGTNLFAWARQIMRNQTIDTSRKRKFEILTDETPEQSAPDNPLEALAATEVDKFIMGELSDNIREVVLLSAQGFKSAEIGEMLNIPAGTVRRQLKEGRDMLGERFYKGAGDE